MTENHDLESSLRDGMQQASLPVVATPELRRRIAAAARSAPARRWWQWRYWTPTMRLLPVVATVLTVLAVGAGAVVVANRPDHSKPVAATEEPTSLSTDTVVPTPSVTPTPSATPTPSMTPSPSPSDTGELSRSQSTVPTTSAPVVNPSAPAGCSTPSGGTANPQTQQQFTSRIVGTWLLCSSPSFFGTSEVGLQIDGNGNWAKLTRDSAGRLVRAAGDKDSGTWSVVDTSAMNGRPTYQVNFEISAIGRTAIAAPVDFAKAVTRMRLNNNGAYVTDYVPTSERVTTGSQPSPTPTPTGSVLPAACTASAGGAVQPTTDQDVAARIAGDWLVCSHPTFFGGNEDGLRVAGDGSWARLTRNAAGTLIASTKPLEHGTWKIIDVSAMNGRPTFQVTFTTTSGSFYVSIPVFAKAVTRMYLDNNGAYSANYVPAP